MNPQNAFYIGISALATIIALVIGGFTWKRRDVPGGLYFSLLMLAIATWTLASAGESAAATMTAKTTWSKFSYLGIVSLSPLWLLFAVSYSRHTKWLTRQRILALWVIPVLILGIVMTNEWHGLIWPSITPVSNESGELLIYSHGPGFWVNIVYAYVLLLAGTIELGRTALRSRHLYRWQVIALIAGTFFPWLGNLIYVLGQSPWQGLDPTPLAFTITGIILALAIFRFRVLDLVPVALDSLIEKMGDGVLVIDNENRVVDINPAACRMMGCNATDTLGQSLTKLLPQCSDLMNQNLDAPERQTEIALNEDRWLEVRISHLNVENKRSAGYLLVLRDVTHRRTETILQEAERRYRDLFENAPVMYVLNRTESNAPVIVDCNQLFLETLGYTRDQVVGRPLGDFYTTESRNQMLDQGWFLKSLRGEHISQERDLAAQDGRIIPTLLRAVPESDAQGTIVGTRAMFLDITERKRAEIALRQAHQELERRVEERTAELTTLNQDLQLEISERQRAEAALRQSESFYQSLVEILPHQLCRKDLGGHFTFGNRTYCGALKITLAELIGKTDFDFHPVDLAEKYRQDDRKVIRTGQASTYVEEHTSLNGDTSYVQVVKTPIYDSAGKVNGVQILFWDITEQKRLQDLLRQSHSAMELHVQERTAELTALYDLSRALASTDALDDIFNLVLQYAVTTVRVTFARLLLLEDSQLVVRAMYPIRSPSGVVKSSQSVSLTDLLYCQSLLQESHALVVHLNDPKIATAEEQLLFQGDAKTLCVVPLRAGEGVLGFLILSEERGELREPFSAEKLRLANSIGDQAVSAIRRATLHDQTERRLEHAQALRKVDTAITSSLDLNVTLNLLLAEAVSLLHADAATILQLNPYAQTLHCLVARGVHSLEMEHAQLRLGQELAGRVAFEQKILRVPELHKKDLPIIRPLLQAIGDLDHYIGVPLIAKGQVKGVLEIFARTPLSLDTDWNALLESFALQAAIAMDNTELFRNLQRSNSDLSMAYEATIEGWSHALDLRDRETEGHSRRVTELTLRLAREINVKEEELGHIRRGALLHDIGKMGIPDAILLKPGQLTLEERTLMQRHTTYAYELLYPIEYLRPALDIPYCHHEKLDGSGYPRELSGEKIPLSARIFAIIDVWDALMSDRPYRAAWPKARVREYIDELAGTHFDPSLVKVFLKMIDET